MDGMPVPCQASRFEQGQQIVGGETRIGGVVEEGLGQRQLLGVQGHDTFLDRVGRDQAIDGDGVALADAVREEKRGKLRPC
jgi:hypothetical protein